jgi:hypothetical protein
MPSCVYRLFLSTGVWVYVIYGHRPAGTIYRAGQRGTTCESPSFPSVDSQCVLCIVCLGIFCFFRTMLGIVQTAYASCELNFCSMELLVDLRPPACLAL